MWFMTWILKVQTLISKVTLRTDAFVASSCAEARHLLWAGVGIAKIQFRLTVGARVSQRASTKQACATLTLHTLPSINASVAVAGIYRYLAQFTRESRQTQTLRVLTESSIQTQAPTATVPDVTVWS